MEEVKNNSISNEERVQLLQDKLDKLEYFSKNLSRNNLPEFELFKKELSELLSGNRRIRFNAIEFYTELHVPSDDDLPF